jgi:hypothetical protein
VYQVQNAQRQSMKIYSFSQIASVSYNEDVMRLDTREAFAHRSWSPIETIYMTLSIEEMRVYNRTTMMVSVSCAFKYEIAMHCNTIQ